MGFDSTITTNRLNIGWFAESSTFGMTCTRFIFCLPYGLTILAKLFLFRVYRKQHKNDHFAERTQHRTKNAPCGVSYHLPLTKLFRHQEIYCAGQGNDVLSRTDWPNVTGIPEWFAIPSHQIAKLKITSVYCMHFSRKKPCILEWHFQ